MHLRGTVLLAFGSFLLAFGSLGLSATTALAADPDYLALFRQQAIKCIHSTVNVDKTQSEIIKGPTTAGDVTTVRIKTYYDGLTKRNVMETDMMIRQAGSIRQMRINQLSDTGTGMGRCDLEKNWRDF